MRPSLSILLAPVMLSACTASPTRPSESAADVTRPGSAAESTELEDVAPLTSNFFYGYKALVRRVVLPDGDVRAWMVARPSFTSEYGVALIAPDSKDESAPWTLTVVTTNVWRKLRTELDGRDEEELGPADFESRSRSMSVGADSAWEIVNAFESVVRRARNPKPEYVFVEGLRYELTNGGGRDGTNYDFCAGEFQGRTWSPEAGPAAELVVLADQLVAMIDADTGMRDEWLRNCVANARALRERVEALPW